MNEIRILSGNQVLKGREKKEGYSAFIWGTKGKCLLFHVVPYAVKRSIHLDSVKSDAPNNTQRLAQTFNYLLLPGRMDSSFPHLSLISSETLNFCGQDANVIWDQKSYIQSIFIYKGIKYSMIDLSDFYRSL